MTKINFINPGNVITIILRTAHYSHQTDLTNVRITPIFSRSLVWFTV